nr:uncharacterized protein LOC109165411 [Ipomoea trifida]
MEESKYVYLLHQRGLFRVKVSSFDEARKHEEELKLECVFYDQSKFICTDMALFSHRHKLFMIGGDSTETAFYRFVPSRFNEFPVKNSEYLDERTTFHGFKPVKRPRVVRAENKIYILPDSVDNFHFQWFDPAGSRFHSLPPPPFDTRADGVYSVSGVLALRDFIYLFIRESCGSCARVFSFSSSGSAPAMQSYSSSVSSSASVNQSYSPSPSPSVPSNEKLSYGSPENEVTGAPSIENQEKPGRSSSSLVSKRSDKEKGKQEEREIQEHDPVALARSLASNFEMNGLDKTRDNALSRSFIRTQLKAITYGLAMMDRADAASEQRIIREAEYAAVEAKVKALELQLEASNKANSAAQARLEALEHEKIKLRETVKAQRKQLRAKDEELVSTRDKAIQEWRQSEEFRQIARSYARENMDSRKRQCRSRD